MKKQTFIIFLEDKDGACIDFERWSFQKVETCVQRMIDLYRSAPTMYGKKLDKADRVVAYATPNGHTMEEVAWSVSAEEFRRMLK